MITVANLINQHQQAVQNEAEARQENLKQQQSFCLKQTLAQAKQYLPDLLEHTGDFTYVINDDRSISYIYALVNLPDLVKFYLVGTRYGGNGNGDLRVNISLFRKNPNSSNHFYRREQQTVSLDDGSQVAKFLFDRQKEWKEAEANRETREIEKNSTLLGSKSEYVEGFKGGPIHPADTLEEAQAAHDQLIGLAPDRAEEWAELHTGWLQRYETRQKKEQERQAQWAQQEAEEKRNEQAFEEAYYEWLKEAIPIFQQNAKAIQCVQAELDNPFQVCDLERGLVAEDEGERYVETDIIAAIPWENGQVFDDQGYCQLLRYHSGVAKKWFINPEKVVGYSEPKTIRPTDKRFYQSLWPDYDYFGYNGSSVVNERNDLYFSPLESKAKVKALIEKRLTPCPPGYPHKLEAKCSKNFTPVREIKRGVEKQVIKELGLDLPKPKKNDDVPF